MCSDLLERAQKGSMIEFRGTCGQGWPTTLCQLVLTDQSWRKASTYATPSFSVLGPKNWEWIKTDPLATS